jgi:carboxylate-amine ligase
LDDALCIASLFRLMVADAIAQPLPGANFNRTAYWILKENRWRAKHYGIHGTFIGQDHEPTISVEQWLTLAQVTFAETAQQLGVQDVFKQARRMLIEGTSADRQRYAVEQALREGRSMPEALARAVDQLLMETGEQPCASPLPQRAVGEP